MKSLFHISKNKTFYNFRIVHNNLFFGGKDFSTTEKNRWLINDAGFTGKVFKANTKLSVHLQRILIRFLTKLINVSTADKNVVNFTLEDKQQKNVSITT